MPYIMLAVTIALECVGSSLLKVSEGFSKLWPSIGCVAAYVACFYLLSRVLEHLPLNVTYATWCAVGIVLTTAVSVLVFKEALNPMVLLGIALTVVGVVLINVFGSAH